MIQEAGGIDLFIGGIGPDGHIAFNEPGSSLRSSSGSLIIEKIFSIPGIGGLYLTSINSMDYDSFMFLSGFYILVGLLASIVIDISYGIIDPRIRMGAK